MLDVICDELFPWWGIQGEEKSPPPFFPSTCFMFSVLVRTVSHIIGFFLCSQMDTGNSWEKYKQGEGNAREAFVPNIQAVSTSVGGVKVR